jgi:hypothetical protein
LTFFKLNHQAAQIEKGDLGRLMLDLLADAAQNRAAQRRWKATEKGIHLGGKEPYGHLGNEVGKGGAEGQQGPEGIRLGAAADGPGGEAEVIGQLVGLVDELVGQAAEVRGRQGMGVVPGFEGVEVGRRRTTATRAELGVAVGAAVGVAAHGPGAAAGCLAAGLVRVSGHGANLWAPL